MGSAGLFPALLALLRARPLVGRALANIDTNMPILIDHGADDVARRIDLQYAAAKAHLNRKVDRVVGAADQYEAR